MARLPQARRPLPAPWSRLPAAVALLVSLAACRPAELSPADLPGSPAAPATIQAAQPTPTATALPSPTPGQAPALPPTPVPEAQPGEGPAEEGSAGANWRRWDNPLLPSPRFLPGMCRHPLTGSLMLFGGSGVWEGYLNDLWLLREDGWYWLEAPGPAPQPRTSPGVAYDEERRVVVLFGGVGANGAFGDTWLFDGTAWTEQHPPSSPSPRTAMVMAYDAARNETVLFGGVYPHGMGGDYLGDTWTWDGTTWTPRAAANSPPPCTSACMVYDAARGNTVLFGGQNDGRDVEGTWIWDGSSWVERRPAHSPPSRVYAGMAYDESRQVVVLFGGLAYGQEANDTWVWDGRDWTEMRPETRPPKAVSQPVVMAYDPSRRAVVLLGMQRGKVADPAGDLLSAGPQVWLWR